MDEVTVNHEMIHIKQQKELFVVGFYLLYVIYWLFNLLWYRVSPVIAYSMIPFEIEAYENEGNLNYLQSRPRFAWLKKPPKKF